MSIEHLPEIKTTYQHFNAKKKAFRKFRAILTTRLIVAVFIFGTLLFLKSLLDLITS